MAYTSTNYRTKKALKEAVASGDRVTTYQPGGMFPLDTSRGTVSVEGPHYPELHRWCATVTVTPDGVITGVK